MGKLPTLLLGVSAFLGAQAVDYPEARRIDELFFSVPEEYPDPYRWLEETGTEESQEWIQAQEQLSAQYLSALEGQQRYAELLQQLREGRDGRGCPFKRGDKYFWWEPAPGEEQPVLKRGEQAYGPSETVLDPNVLSVDGTVGIAGVTVSPDGKLIAYAKRDGGCDWTSWEFLEIDSGVHLADTLEWTRHSTLYFAPDSKSVFYCKYDTPKQGRELINSSRSRGGHIHRFGTDQSEDLPIPEHGFSPIVSHDGWYLLTSTGWCHDMMFDAEDAFVRIGDGKYVGNRGDTFWYLTDTDAPKKRIFAVSRFAPDERVDVVDEKTFPIEEAVLCGDALIVHYLEHTYSCLRAFTVWGEPLGEIPLPGPGSVRTLESSGTSGELLFSFESLKHPKAIYRCVLGSGKVERLSDPFTGWDLDELEMKQEFYSSKDGTPIPMTICHKKGLVKDGSTPCILYGYGGFNFAIPCFWSEFRGAWLHDGGVFAIAHIRGGGEYGEGWHKQGMGKRKQNCFDDFIAAAEYLIEQGYTSSEHLAIRGRSNGGLLVGACMVQRPDLYAACVPQVGVLDMLRFDRWTCGSGWSQDYGSPMLPKSWHRLRSISPYHNLEEGVCYPATLVTTADRDDRVVPWHSYKFAAQLQHCQGGDAPVLLMNHHRSGHGFNIPKSMGDWEDASIFAFLREHLQ